jgi:hypothetical protein
VLTVKKGEGIMGQGRRDKQKDAAKQARREARRETYNRAQLTIRAAYMHGRYVELERDDAERKDREVR